MARWTHDALDRLAARVARAEAGLVDEVSTSIHDDVAGEIVAVAEKAAPVDADVALIEDSASSDAKKRIELASIPRTHFETRVIYQPIAGNDYGLWFHDRAITVKQVRIWFAGMVAASIRIRYGSRNQSAYTNIVNGSWWGNATTGADCTLNATSVPADQVWWLRVNALSSPGTYFEIGCFIEYEYTR